MCDHEIRVVRLPGSIAAGIGDFDHNGVGDIM